MESLKKVYGKRNAFIVFGILVALMIVGSFADYPFAKLVYNQQNPFGIAFAAFGEAPAGLGLIISGLLLIIGRNKERKGLAVFQMIAGILLLILGCGMVIYLPSNYLENQFLAYGIGVLLAALTVFMTVRLSKNTDRVTMIKIVSVIVLVALNVVIVNIIKIPWGRPRMRLIDEDVGAYFTNWWVAGSAVKTKLAALNIASDEFKSFPSGHTANAAMAMLLPLLALMSDKLRGKECLLFIIGAVWGLLVALSRTIMGAHFITDTTVGFAITYALILISVHCVFFRGKKADLGAGN